jgi:hypothetical protein
MSIKYVTVRCDANAEDIAQLLPPNHHIIDQIPQPKNGTILYKIEADDNINETYTINFGSMAPSGRNFSTSGTSGMAGSSGSAGRPGQSGRPALSETEEYIEQRSRYSAHTNPSTWGGRRPAFQKRSFINIIGGFAGKCYDYVSQPIVALVIIGSISATMVFLILWKIFEW